MNILVLAGGNSPERAISLRSAEAVTAALNDLGHNVSQYDTASGLDGLAQYRDVAAVLPILHGKDGEDGVVQARLEQLGLPFLGSGSAASRLCFDKVAFKAAIKALGYLTPAWQVITAATIGSAPLLAGPYVLKPNDGGSSIDTFIVRHPKENQADYQPVFARNPEMLLEELIDGREITVAVLGDKALPVIEIIPPANEEFDYANKYNGKTQELCPPLNVSADEQQQAQAIAVGIHQALGVRHLSRTDILINDQGDMYVLELNTIPGLTNQSLFPRAAAVVGLSMPELIQALLEMVTGQPA